MIKIFYKEDIIKHIAAILTYGLNNNFSYSSIERRILESSLISNLESNKYDIDSKFESSVESAYGIKLSTKCDISFRALFLAESYIKLFFDFNKSFEYIFLYWPLERFANNYGVYHEMDYSNLRNDFKEKISECTLLKKLAKKVGLKITEISKLTGINANSIDKYSRSDDALYGASNNTLYTLSMLFGVKTNIFATNLSVFLDNSIYLFDKSNDTLRSFLGMYFANYFDKRISEYDFEYQKRDNIFTSKKDKTILKVISINKANIDIEAINQIADENTYLVIFPHGYFDYSLDAFLFLKETKAKEIMIVTQESAYLIKKRKDKEITDTINRSLTVRAKISSSINN